MKSEIINRFENDVFFLIKDLYELNSYRLLHKHLLGKTAEEEFLKAMNKAPAFFQLTINSFQYSTIMGLARLYEPAIRNSRGLFSLLNYIEQHHTKIFSNDPETMVKLGRKTEINHSTVMNYREKLAEIDSIINNLISWRDKSFAHNDKKYFGIKGQLGKDYPITYGDIEKLINLAEEILNTFQVGYNGNTTLIIPDNTYDVNKVLMALL